MSRAVVPRVSRAVVLRVSRTVVLPALLAGAVAGCHRGGSHCAPTTRSTLELRDGAGGLVLALKSSDLCDAQLRWTGSFEQRAEGLTVRDAAGAVRLELIRESSNAAAGRTREGRHLRLYRDSHQLRVLGAEGIPLGSVVAEGNAAVILDAASQPLGKVAMRDRDAVVTDMAGSAQVYVVPARDPGTAGVFGVPSLDPAEALAIYLYWSR